MTWIKTPPPRDLDEKAQKLYARVTRPDGGVDNILTAHALRSHTLEGHMALYKAVLHHRANTLPKVYLEAVGVYVSVLNGCAYCVEHHGGGLRRLTGDDARSGAVIKALQDDAPERAFEGRELAGLRYARALTRDAAGLSRDDAEALRTAGFDDGEVLELNQVAAYFAYANRMVLGLGISIDGEPLGASPSDESDAKNWRHR